MELELINSIIETKTEYAMEKGDTVRYNKKYLSDAELKLLLKSKFEDYEVYSDSNNYDYIVIERITEREEIVEFFDENKDNEIKVCFSWSTEKLNISDGVYIKEHINYNQYTLEKESYIKQAYDIKSICQCTVPYNNEYRLELMAFNEEDELLDSVIIKRF